MPIERAPQHQLPPTFVPPGGAPYPVKDGDTWKTVASNIRTWTKLNYKCIDGNLLSGTSAMPLGVFESAIIHAWGLRLRSARRAQAKSRTAQCCLPVNLTPPARRPHMVGARMVRYSFASMTLSFAPSRRFYPRAIQANNSYQPAPQIVAARAKKEWIVVEQ